MRNYGRLAVGLNLAAALTLAGCAGSSPVRTQTVEVKVPVAVQPIRADQIPAPPAPLGARPASLSAATDVLLSRWCQAVGYILRADPLLRVSAGSPQRELPKYPECGDH